MADEELPPGWAWARIGELCTLVNGRAFKPTDWKDHGLPIIRIQNLNNRKSAFNRYPGAVDDRHLVTDGELLFAWSGTPGTSFGAHVWRGGTAVLNQHIFRVVHEPRLVDRDYFRHAINQSLDAIIAQAHGGAGLAHITKGRFEETVIPLPPLRQQARIAKAIEANFDELDEAEGALARAREGVEQFRASLLHAACTGQLTAAWREANPPTETGADLLHSILAERRAAWERTERARLKARGTPPRGDSWKARYEEPAALNLTELPDLPAGWVWATVEQMAFVSGGLTKNTRRARLATTIQYLRVANVGEAAFNLDDVRTIGVEASELPRLLLKPGDLLFVEGNGSADQIGRVALWAGQISQCVHQNHLIKARPATEGIGPWLLAWFMSPLGKRFVRDAASSTSGLHTLSLGKISALPCPIPPHAELCAAMEIQSESMPCVSETNIGLDDLQSAGLTLRQSILHAAFTGKLVPQDPGDEPAAALLPRLRGAAAPARRTRRRTPAEASA